jgi:hypothetical protein
MTLTPSKILELLAALCFILATAGFPHLGVVQLTPLGLFFLALGLAV